MVYRLSSFPNMLFVGKERELGIFAELLPAVLYKRGDMADWARFCNIFGMPIREYTYDAGDEQARRRLVAEARSQGPMRSTYTQRIPNLRSSRRPTSRARQSFTKHLPNIGTPKFQSACSAIHSQPMPKKQEHKRLVRCTRRKRDEMNADDRDFILDTFSTTTCGKSSPTSGSMSRVASSVMPKRTNQSFAANRHRAEALSMGLPIDDDHLYETFCIAKPDNYDELKAQEARRRGPQCAMRSTLQTMMGTTIRRQNKKRRLKHRSKNDKKPFERFFRGSPRCQGRTPTSDR